MHGGTCQQDGTSYACTCTASYTGDNCETGEIILEYVFSFNQYLLHQSKVV